jgi:thymidylate kinase
VRAGYQELIAVEPARWVVVDASRPPEAVAAELQKAVLSRIKKR